MDITGASTGGQPGGDSLTKFWQASRGVPTVENQLAGKCSPNARHVICSLARGKSRDCNSNSGRAVERSGLARFPFFFFSLFWL